MVALHVCGLAAEEGELKSWTVYASLYCWNSFLLTNEMGICAFKAKIYHTLKSTTPIKIRALTSNPYEAENSA